MDAPISLTTIHHLRTPITTTTSSSTPPRVRWFCSAATERVRVAFINTTRACLVSLSVSNMAPGVRFDFITPQRGMFGWLLDSQSSANRATTSMGVKNNVSLTVTTVPLKAIHADFFGNEIELYMSNITTTYLFSTTPNTRIHKDHSLDHVIGDVQSGEEPKKVIQELKDPSWIEAMQEELLQFKLQQVYMNKKDERSIVIRNKARLVAQGYTQEEGIDYDEVFAPVARIEAIRLFLAYASFKDFVVYEMDVNSAFLYGKIEEEVYVYQPSGFEDPEFPDKVYKVEKALYGLYQSPKAWYETLSTYLLDNGFQRGQIDKTLFIKKVKSDILLVQIIDVPNSSRPDIMFVVCACVRFQVTPKLSHLHAVKRIFRYLKGQPKLGLWYSKDSLFDLEAYTDSDYAGASLDRKSTTQGCQFLGSRLISCQCKKQTIVANSTTEAKYEAIASCYGQVLWIKNQMLDYGYNFMNTRIFIDNESTICIVKNLLFHSKTKHIEIRHHFIRDSNEKKLIQMIKIHTDQNVIDLLTKAFDVGRFQYLIAISAGDSKLMLLDIHLLLQVLFNAVRHTLAISSVKLLLPDIAYYCWAIASAKTTAWNEFSSTMALAIICLATNQNFNFSKYIFDNMVKNLDGGVKFLMYPREQEKPQKKQLRRKQRNDTEVPQPSGSTEPITDEAANEEHERVKKLERRNKSRTPGLKRLRKIFDVDSRRFTFWLITQGRNDDNLMFDIEVLYEQEADVEKVKAFDKTMRWIDSFVSMDSKVVKRDKEKDEGSVTRAGKRRPIKTLWKLVKAKYGNTRPEEAYERVLWGDLKVMFEPDVESEIWRNLQGYNVTVWKLFSSSGVHFVRFQNLHIFMLVEKKYPLTPVTIIKMLNKKLQTNHWNEMCYQLLKLMTKLVKDPRSV
ncbi:putative reverse transcriptase, RNA-dependent DNA polymerase [Tanacetum coccineum]